MSQPLNFRDVIQALFPDGVIWNPVEGGFYDNILKGVGDNVESAYVYLKLLASVRDPFATLLLTDLEKEYGIVSDFRLTEDERRTALSAIKYAKPKSGSASELEIILRDAGFDVRVHQNNPPVDPATFIDADYQMVAGGDLAYAGDPEAYAGFVGSDLLVNGDNFTATVLYEMQAAGAEAFAGEPSAVAGYFLDVEKDYIEYELPVSSDRWPFVFFIGGEVTGWLQLKDWKMEKEHTADWIAAAKTTLSKDTAVKESGARSLKIVSVNQDIEEQLIIPEQPDSSLKKAYGLRNVIGGFAYPDNYWNALEDGDMERTGAGLWTAGNSATLSKQVTSPHSGSQLLRIAYNGVANPYAYDSQAPFTIGQVYRVKGWARSDGTAVPQAYHPWGTPVWTGTNSTSWQPFDVTFLATATTGSIGTTLGVAGYVEFDDVVIFELPAFADGGMEAAGTAFWNAGNAAVLTKSTEFPFSGLQALRVAHGASPDPYAYQNALNTHLGANDFPYKVTGYARSDGDNIPKVLIGSLVIWTGTKSTNWQYFEFTRLATHTEIRFQSSSASVAGYSEFDAVQISPVLGAVGPVTGTSFAQTALGSARDFNGSSDFITGASHIGILGFELDDRFTLTAWMKTTDTQGSLISRNNVSLQWDWSIFNSKMRFSESSGGGTNYDGVTDVDTDELVYVAVVIDGASSQLYVNGQTDGSTFNPTITKQAVSTLFGANTNGTANYFDGVMIAPQIYSEAKDAAWIATQYQVGLAAQLAGSYAEQIIVTDEVEIPIQGFAWSDDIDAVPCVAILDPADDLWKIIWVGSGLTPVKQSFSVDVPAGIKGIRLYNKFSANGYVNFDDVSVINPFIERAQIPAELEGIFKRFIMKYKPLHSWAGLVVEYI